MVFEYTFISDEDYKIAAANGVDRKNVSNRVYQLGWSVKKAIITPIKTYKKTNYGITKEQREIAYKNGILRQTLDFRLKKGMSIQEAITMPTMTPSERGKLKKLYKEKNKYGCDI